MNWGAFFNKVCVNCYPKVQTISYVSSDTQLLTLPINMTNNEIGRGMVLILCYKLKMGHFSHIWISHLSLLLYA